MKLKGAIIGCGFFASNHILAWKEIKNVEIIAVCDLNINKANYSKKKYKIKYSYSSVLLMVKDLKLNFVDVITTMETHLSICKILSKYSIPTSIQKPFSNKLINAKKIVDFYKKNNTILMVHENFRWQTPIMKLKKIIDKYNLGKPIYAKISFRHSNPIGYINQPYLYKLKKYLILDVGIHLYDLSRYFMGNAKNLFTINQNTNKKFKGETNFTSLVHHNNGGVSIIDASISSIKKPDRFAQTLINIECQKGSIDLDYNYKIILHKNDKKLIFYANPKKYNWISKPWDQIQESVVNTHKHFIKCLLNKKIPDTSGKDNLRSLEMVFASYESNKRNKIIKLEL